MSPRRNPLWLLPLGPDQIRGLLPHRARPMMPGYQYLIQLIEAERVGFEPTRLVKAYTISNRTH